MKRLTTILMSLTLIVVLCLAFVGCQTKEYIPDKQGSMVMTMDDRNISGYETDIFNSYGEFSGSEYGGMKLNGSNYPAKKSYYRRSFFSRHKLIATRFNDDSSVLHFINNIVYEDGIYTITILRFRPVTEAPASKQTYVAMLEVPTRKDIQKDTRVLINMQPVQTMPDLVVGNSIISSEDALSLSTITTYSDMQSYTSRVDDKTRENLAVFDAEFFTTQALIAIDYMGYDSSVLTYDYNDNSKELNLNVYHSDHYTKTSDVMGRHVTYLPISLTDKISKIMFNTYWEADIDTPNIDTHQEIDLSTLRIKD